jgi:anaerobic magnesium-protoporphyrin IX monomethyl ester cyclase
VIIGGVHISFLPSSFKKCFDLGIVGEGELPLYHFMNLFMKERKVNKDALGTMDGFVFYDDDQLIVRPQEDILIDLDEIPPNDMGLVNKKYFSMRPEYTTGKYVRWSGIMTARGCPYDCKFCVSTRFFKKLRFNSSKRIVDEIKELYYNHDVRHIVIWDDLFCCNIPRLKEIIDLLEAEKLLGKITFNTSIRGNLANDNVFKLYKKLGVVSIGFGFESGSDKMLKYLKGEGISVKDNLNAMKESVKRGFKTMASFMIGVPTETVEDMRMTHDAIKECIRLGASRLFFFVLTPYPGSFFWELAKERGKVSDDMDFSVLSFHDNVPLLLDETVPVKEYKEIRKNIVNSINQIKYKCVKEYFMDNPIRTIFSVILKPSRSLLKAIGLKNEREEVAEI